MDALMGSKTVATLLTWLVLVVFCALVFTGWWYLFATVLDNGWGAAAVAFLITLLAAVCARQVAQYRAAASERGEAPAWHTGWKFYIFLAVISALGTLNAAFILFESRAILRTDISQVRHSYSALRDAAHVQLTPPGYKEQLARIDALLGNLHQEIVNPNRGAYCGVGPSARAIIADIQAEIPSYRVLNGSSAINPCDVAKAEQVYQSYERMAKEMAKGDVSSIGAGGPVKLEFIDHLDGQYAEMDSALAALESRASGFGGIESIDLGPLYHARDDYNADRLTFVSLGGTANRDIPSIDSLQTDEVNSYAATVNLFRKRLLHVTTWFYLLIAFGLDFALIFLATQLNIRYGGRQSSVKVAVERRFYTDPRFLWTGPSTNRRSL